MGKVGHIDRDTADPFLCYLQAQKFINEYANFLKRQGKLPIPGSWAPVLPAEDQKRREKRPMWRHTWFNGYMTIG